MNITTTRLKIELKRALCCSSEKMADYADKIGIGTNDRKLFDEIGLLNAYIDTMRFMVLETTELDVDTIFFQTGNTIRYTFNNLPNISPNYNILFDVGISDNLVVATADKAINNGNFPILKVGGLSDQLLALDVNTIVHQGNFTVRYTFNGSPDLSGILVNDRLITTLATNDVNNGDFRIAVVNDGSDFVEVINVARPDDEFDEATNSPAVSDIKRAIDFIEIDNQGRSDNTDDEASDSPATAVVKFSVRNYTDSQISDILERINEICKNCGKAYIETS